MPLSGPAVRGGHVRVGVNPLLANARRSARYSSATAAQLAQIARCASNRLISTGDNAAAGSASR